MPSVSVDTRLRPFFNSTSVVLLTGKRCTHKDIDRLTLGSAPNYEKGISPIKIMITKLRCNVNHFEYGDNCVQWWGERAKGIHRILLSA